MMTKLSSDILEEQFGPTTIDILFQEDKKRIIQTRCISDGRILEVSYVQFDLAGADIFPIPHAEVLAGESMGKVFARHGIAFIRDTPAVFRSHVPRVFQEKFHSQAMPLLMNTTVLVGAEHVRYATVLEIYHPDVQWSNPETGHAWPFTQALAEFEQLLTSNSLKQP